MHCYKQTLPKGVGPPSCPAGSCSRCGGGGGGGGGGVGVGVGLEEELRVRQKQDEDGALLIFVLRYEEIVKSGSTPVGGPVKSGRKWTKEKGRGLDKGLVRPELRPIGFNDKGVEC